MKSTRRKSKIAGLFLALLVLIITLGAFAVTAFAAEGSLCTSTESCAGTYVNGFCSVCSGYEPALRCKCCHSKCSKCNYKY